MLPRLRSPLTLPVQEICKLGVAGSSPARTISENGLSTRATDGARVFQDVLDGIEFEPVRDALSSAVEARIPQG